MLYSDMERFFKLLIWYSVGTYFLEIASGSADSLQGSPFFLWSERVVAAIFTIEIVWRLSYYYMIGRFFGDKPYLNTARFWVDMLAVVPFYVGFFVPAEWLGWIRTLRVLRLLKLYWYSKGIRDLCRAFVRARKALKGALVCMTTVVLFASALLLQAEGQAQPDKFDNIGNCIYYCLTTATTCGFGEYVTVTPLGRLITIFILYGPAIMIAAASIGIIGAAYQEELSSDEENS